MFIVCMSLSRRHWVGGDELSCTQLLSIVLKIDWTLPPFRHLVMKCQLHKDEHFWHLLLFAFHQDSSVTKAVRDICDVNKDRKNDTEMILNTSRRGASSQAMICLWRELGSTNQLWNASKQPYGQCRSLHSANAPAQWRNQVEMTQPTTRCSSTPQRSRRWYFFNNVHPNTRPKSHAKYI